MCSSDLTSAPKPSELAAGISTALITTLVGLVLAIPAIGLFGIYKNRLSRYSLEVGIISEGLMSRFQAFGDALDLLPLPLVFSSVREGGRQADGQNRPAFPFVEFHSSIVARAPSGVPARMYN